MTEDDRREGVEGTKDNARGKYDEDAKHEDREMGGAEDVNPEGEGTSGALRKTFRMNSKKRNGTSRQTFHRCNAWAGA